MKAGFSLIEALVAMAVVSMALLAIYGLQLQLTAGEARSERALATAAMQENDLAVIRDINPARTPAGALPLAGGKVLRWSSAPLTPPGAAKGADQTPSRFKVQLFAVHAEVVDARGQILASVRIERVGWSAPPTTSAARSP